MFNRIKPQAITVRSLFFESGSTPPVSERVLREPFEKISDYLRCIEIEQGIIGRKPGGEIRTGPDVSPTFDLA